MPRPQRVPDFWRNSGFHLLERDAAGRLALSDDFLRAYFLRPELHPVEDSCDAERGLHAALMQAPRRPVTPDELAALRDADVRENYGVMLRFRQRLLDAGTIEGCYAGLFGAAVDVPPLFVDQLAHVTLRNILDGCDDPLRLRAAELFFREQRFALVDGDALLADRETVESGAAYDEALDFSLPGALGRLIAEAQGPAAKPGLDVLDRGNAAIYWERESRHDTAISLAHGRAAPEALARVIEAWVAHFLHVRVTVRALAQIEEAHWAWHVGLDAESTSILNDIWSGAAVEHERMRRVLALFSLRFEDPSTMRRDIAGRLVYLALSADAQGVVKMKPQNLLLNLPLAVHA